MLIHDRFVFLQLQKTACTHIATELHARLGGRLSGKHQPLQRRPERALVVGSVRDPWDWYVSLWAYGCSGRGAVRKALAERETLGEVVRRNWRRPTRLPGLVARARRDHDIAFWQRVYRDANDPGAFRDWLTRLLTTGAKAEVFEGPLPPGGFEPIGLYSARYAYMFSVRPDFVADAPRLDTPEEVEAFLERRCIVDRFIRMEHLETDLADLLTELGQPCTADDLRGEKRNASRRRSHLFYHDAATIALIAAQDAAVARRHDYAAPDAGMAG